MEEGCLRCDTKCNDQFFDSKIEKKVYEKSYIDERARNFCYNLSLCQYRTISRWKHKEREEEREGSIRRS